MSWLMFTLSPIVGATVAYFDPVIGVQMAAAGLCAGAGIVAITGAAQRQARPALVPVRAVTARRGLVAPASR